MFREREASTPLNPAGRMQFLTHLTELASQSAVPEPFHSNPRHSKQIRHLRRSKSGELLRFTEFRQSVLGTDPCRLLPEAKDSGFQKMQQLGVLEAAFLQKTA